MRLLVGLVAALALVFVAGCGGGSSKTAETPAKGGPPLDATPIDPATAATISGTITLDGPAPAEEQINMSADPVCKAAHPKPMFTERAVVRDGKVQWAFVYVKTGLEGRAFAPPAEPALLDQLGCRYIPHVLGVRVGQSIKLLNSDETLHNVHAMPEHSKAFNVGLAEKGMSMSRKFTAPEVMVPVKCDVHSWMQGFIGVMAHPFFAVSDENGAFTISGLPPGTYTLAVWHETFGEQAVEVTLGPSETKTADFTLKAKS